MASHPMGPGPSWPYSEWHSAAPAATRGHLVACVRAGVIAAVLLTVLALLVWF